MLAAAGRGAARALVLVAERQGRDRLSPASAAYREMEVARGLSPRLPKCSMKSLYRMDSLVVARAPVNWPECTVGFPVARDGQTVGQLQVPWRPATGVIPGFGWTQTVCC